MKPAVGKRPARRRRTAGLAAAVLCLLALGAFAVWRLWGTADERPAAAVDGPQSQALFDATVTQVTKKYIAVQCYRRLYGEVAADTAVRMPTTLATGEDFPALEAGDRVRVLYAGSLPAAVDEGLVLPQAVSVRLLGEDNIPVSAQRAFGTQVMTLPGAGEDSFYATVTAVYDDCLLVQSYKNPCGEAPVGSSIQCSTQVTSYRRVPEVQAGDRVIVQHAGEVWRLPDGRFVLEETVSLTRLPAVDGYRQLWFDAVVTGVFNGYITAECSSFLSGRTPLQVSTDLIIDEPPPALAVGDRVRIMCTGNATLVDNELIVPEKTVYIRLLDENGRLPVVPAPEPPDDYDLIPDGGQISFSGTVTVVHANCIEVACTSCNLDSVPVGARIEASTDVIIQMTVPELAVGDAVDIDCLGGFIQTRDGLYIAEDVLGIWLAESDTPAA